MTDNVRTIGVVGAGSVAFKSHLPLLMTMGIQIPWIIDQSPVRARTAAEAYSIAKYFTPEELDCVTPTDIVLLTCPYGVRKHYFEFFAHKPAALYVEKPVARTIAELDQICMLRAPHQIAAGFIRRSMGATNIVRRLVKDHLFGRLRRVRSEFGTSAVISGGASFTKDVSLAGGGQLFESAIHNIDAICFMIGARSACVKSAKMVHEDGFDLHTEAIIDLIDMEENQISVDLLVTCFHNTNYEIHLEFDNVTVAMSLFKPMLPEVRSRGSSKAYQLVDSVAKEYPRQTFDVAYVFWSEFLKGIRERQENYTNATTTRVTASIIEQLYAQHGKWYGIEN